MAVIVAKRGMLAADFDTMSISMYTLTATFLAPIDQARLISCSKPRLGLLSGVSLPSPRKALSDYIMTSLKSLVGRVCAQLRQALLVYELADTDMLVVRMRDLPMSLLLPEGQLASYSQCPHLHFSRQAWV